MKKILFVISQYTDYRQDIFNNIISPNNKKYCEKHGFKYIVIGNDNKITTPFRNNLTWEKIYIIKKLIDDLKIKNDDIIINQDADMIWYNTDYSFEPEKNKNFSISIDSGNTFCFGSFGVRINDWSKKLISNILDDNLWNNTLPLLYKDESFPEKPLFSFANLFREQAMFYYLFGIKKHSWEPFKNMDNLGIHSDVTKFTKFSLDEANKNLDIKPTNFNVTCWENESDLTYYINKLNNKSDVYLRHFTGCDWNVVKNWI
jgi:hypothetical protein